MFSYLKDFSESQSFIPQDDCTDFRQKFRQHREGKQLVPVTVHGGSSCPQTGRALWHQ